MKKMKQLLSVLFAAIMILVMSTTVFAAQEGDLADGSITIEDAVKGQTYSIYQILYLESYNASSNAYAYKANNQWKSWLETQTSYVSIDEQGYVTWVKDADAAAFAKAAQDYAGQQKFASDSTAVTAADHEVKFENLKLGYYLVDSTLGTLCSLDTTNPSVVIEEKNETPANEKTVEEDSTGSYSNVNDANIGQTVNFKSTITLPKGSENIVFHDEMSAGLTPDIDSIKVYTDTGMTAELTAGNYTVISTGLTDGCTFEISFTRAYLDSLTDSTTVYVKYAATVNEKAVVRGEGNTNESKVSYGDSTNTKTTPGSITTTYTWDVNVFKYAMDGQTEKPLAGATFTLSKDSKGTNPIALICEKDDQSNDIITYRVAKPDETNAVTSITTDATGKFTIEGLDSGTYYLTETAAPAGYNKLADPITIDIDKKGVVNGTDDAPQGVDEVKILNQTGAELPSTGGMGTAIFYIMGAVLVVGAGILLVVRRRMSTEK